MIETYDGHTPIVPENCFVHKLASLRGKVELGDLCIVLPGAAVTGDTGRIRIGHQTLIEESCVIHAGTFEQWRLGVEAVLDIGSNVVLGHGAVIHARSIGSHTLIGMNATVLEGVEIGSECVIAAGAVVTENMIIPERSFVAGVPAKIRGAVSDKHMDRTHVLAEVSRQYFIDTIRKLKESTPVG
jgi:carbonic anhydrase/acetyltransferase-like protein (isoleucine patch superfamily)